MLCLFSLNIPTTSTFGTSCTEIFSHSFPSETRNLLADMVLLQLCILLRPDWLATASEDRSRIHEDLPVEGPFPQQCQYSNINYFSFSLSLDNVCLCRFTTIKCLTSKIRPGSIDCLLKLTNGWMLDTSSAESMCFDIFDGNTLYRKHASIEKYVIKTSLVVSHCQRLWLSLSWGIIQIVTSKEVWLSLIFAIESGALWVRNPEYQSRDKKDPAKWTVT